MLSLSSINKSSRNPVLSNNSTAEAQGSLRLVISLIRQRTIVHPCKKKTQLNILSVRKIASCKKKPNFDYKSSSPPFLLRIVAPPPARPCPVSLGDSSVVSLSFCGREDAHGGTSVAVRRQRLSYVVLLVVPVVSRPRSRGWS